MDASSGQQGTHSQQQSAHRSLVERLHSDRAAMMQFQQSNGSSTAKGLFLINGGAAVAMLALLGNVLGRSEPGLMFHVDALVKGCRLGLVCYGCGLLASVCASAFGYINTNFLLETMATPQQLYGLETGQPIKPAPDWKWLVVRLTYRCAPIVSLISALLFMRGGLFITHALR